MAFCNKVCPAPEGAGQAPPGRGRPGPQIQRARPLLIQCRQRAGGHLL